MSEKVLVHLIWDPGARDRRTRKKVGGWFYVYHEVGKDGKERYSGAMGGLSKSLKGTIELFIKNEVPFIEGFKEKMGEDSRLD